LRVEEEVTWISERAESCEGSVEWKIFREDAEVWRRDRNRVRKAPAAKILGGF
jgi:hypothetical protein